MLSQTAEYALRAMAHLASLPEEAQTAQQIAGQTLVPLPYLSKVLQLLGKAGLISAQRGLHGGFRLLRLPTEITIYEVVQAVDPLKRITVCPLAIATHGSNLCPLHRQLDNAVGQIEESFRSVTLAEVLSEPGSNRPLCATPNPAV